MNCKDCLELRVCRKVQDQIEILAYKLSGGDIDKFKYNYKILTIYKNYAIGCKYYRSDKT